MKWNALKCNHLASPGLKEFNNCSCKVYVTAAGQDRAIVCDAAFRVIDATATDDVSVVNCRNTLCMSLRSR